MPYPTYHVGVNFFFGLALRRWVDPFVIVAANVVIDLEVLFAQGFPDYHRHWHFHTFLVGGAVGAMFGLFCWFFRNYISGLMKFLRIPYTAGPGKMILAGTLGFWIHVLMDSVWHWDVQPFWPFSKRNSLWHLFRHTYPDDQVHKVTVVICTVLLIAAAVLYVLAVKNFSKQKKSDSS